MSQADKGVLIFNEWFEAMEKLCARDYKKLMNAIYMCQVYDKEPPIFEGKVEVLARVIFPCIDRRKKRSVAGKLGYQARLNFVEENVDVASSKGVSSATPMLTPKEKNSKEKNGTVKQSEFISGADARGRADEVGLDEQADALQSRCAVKRARGKHGNVFLSEVEYEDICNLIFNADIYIDRFSEKLHDKGYRFADHYRALLDWWERDKGLPSYSEPRGFLSSAAEREQPRERSAEDEHWDEFFEAAVKRSLGEGA